MELQTKKLELELVTYGKGSSFKLKKFEPVKNKQGYCKPEGGLWSSPVTSSWGWKDWCEAENFGDLNNYFSFIYEGNVYTIDNQEDLLRLPMLMLYRQKYIDFEKVMKRNVGALLLTEEGERRTRLTEPGLYGWDCECVLILKPQGILLGKKV